MKQIGEISTQIINNRRVFYVDVGDMPVHKAIEYIEKIKNEIIGKSQHKELQCQ